MRYTNCVLSLSLVGDENNSNIATLTHSACDMIADTLMCARLSIKDQLTKHFSVLISGLRCTALTKPVMYYGYQNA